MTKKEKRLTIKEKKFVEEYAKKGNGTKAVLAAGYEVVDKSTAAAMSTNMLKKDHIKNALDNKFKEMYPEMEQDIVCQVKTALKAPLKINDGISINELTQLIKALSSLRGWIAPTKHQSLHADLTSIANKVMDIDTE